MESCFRLLFHAFRTRAFPSRLHPNDCYWSTYCTRLNTIPNILFHIVQLEQYFYKPYAENRIASWLFCFTTVFMKSRFKNKHLNLCICKKRISTMKLIFSFLCSLRGRYQFVKNVWARNRTTSKACSRN